MTQALTTIRSEHRSIAAVLHGLRHLVQEFRAGARPNFALLRAMVFYIDTYPERVHHPHEDKYLFHALRQRTHQADALLDELEGEHIKGVRYLAHLKQSLAEYEAGLDGGLPVFASAVDDYADFHWAHMRKEEDELMPLAVKHLTADDWQWIDAGFARNDDPLAGVLAKAQYEKLFSRIVNLAPPPIGVGPALSKTTT